MKGNVESMLSVGDLPWHNEGVNIPKDKSITMDEALKLSGLDWTVSLHDMYYQLPTGEFRTYDKHKVIARDSDGMPYGVPTGKYKPLNNFDAFDWVNALFDYGAKVETAGALDNGGCVWILIKMGENFKIVGDEYIDYLMLANWHDGKHSVSVTKTNVRVVCLNTFNKAIRDAFNRWNCKHMGDMRGKLAEATEALELNNSFRAAQIAYAESMATKKVSNQVILDLAFPLPDASASRTVKANIELQRDIFTECLNKPDLANFQGTAWGAIQAASDYSMHVRPMRSSEKYNSKRLYSLIASDDEFQTKIGNIVEVM